MQLNNQPKPLIAMRNEIPSQLSMLVDKLMEKSPKNRPESWEEVAERIDTLLQGLKNSQEKKEEELLLQLQARNRVRLRKAVVAGWTALAFVLVILLVVLVVANPLKVDPHADDPRVPSSLPGGNEDESGSLRAAKTEALAKWNFLKTRLPAMDTESARRELKKYLDEHTFDVEEEALEYYDFLGRKGTFEKSLSEFKKRLRTLETDCRKKKYIHSDKENELKTQVSALSSLFGKNYAALCEQAPLYGVSPASLDEGKKSMLEAYRRTLEARLNRIHDNQQAKIQAKIQAEKAKLIREEKERKQFLESCDADFKNLCGKIASVRDRDSAQWFLESLEKWWTQYASGAPAEYKECVASLRLIFPDAFVPEHELLHKFRSSLSGQEILPGYRFLDASGKGMLCQQKDAGGTHVEKRIPWSKLREKTGGRSILSRIVTAPKVLRSLNADQQTKLFKYLLSERHPAAFYWAYLEQSEIPSDSKKELMLAAQYYLFLLSESAGADPNL